MDSQPEFPLRTYLTFANKYETSRINNLDSVSEGDVLNPTASTGLRSSSSQSRGDNFPYGTIFILWIFGLVLWCYVYVFGVSDWKRRKSGRGKNSDKNK